MFLSRLKLVGPYAPRMGRKTSYTVNFVPGVNLLIGVNGSGKSTVVECLTKEVLVKEKRNRWGDVMRNQKRHADWRTEGDGRMEIFAFDFEKQNARMAHVDGVFSIEDMQKIMARNRYEKGSHGAFSRAVLNSLDERIQKCEKGGDGALVVLDEPEQALDLDALQHLLDILNRVVKPPHQAIVATHHPFLIAQPGFNVIELTKGYKDRLLGSMQRALESDASTA